MGAEALYDLLRRLDLDELSYDLRHKAKMKLRSKEKMKP
jgi:DNA-directed RNA polymerase subunit beta'